MLHQPYSGITGQAEDIRIQAEEILKDKKLLNEILAKHTGQARRKSPEEIERDRFMDGRGSPAYGLVDEILEHEQDKKKKKVSDADGRGRPVRCRLSRRDPEQRHDTAKPS